MSPLPVVEHLDVLRDLAASVLTGLVAPVMHQLILQCPPETLHRRVVIAVALPAHGRGHAELPQLLLIVLSTILGGFNRSTQHWVVRRIVGTGLGLRLVSSNQASSAVWY